MLRTHPEHQFDGDGTVPRTSATPRELENAHVETFVAAVHGSLQNTDAALVQLVGLLSGLRPAERGRVPQVSLTVDDAFAVGEPIRISGRCDDRNAALVAVVTDVGTRAEVARRTVRQGEEERAFEVELAPLPEGAYRARVEGTYPVAEGVSRQIDAVSDVFIVST
jgi:hypothetical protein